MGIPVNRNVASGVNISQASETKEAEAEQKALAARIDSDKSVQDMQNAETTPAVISKKGEKTQKPAADRVRKMMMAQKAGKVTAVEEKGEKEDEEASNKFADDLEKRSNKELTAKGLMNLRAYMKAHPEDFDNKDKILKSLLQVYKDPSLVDQIMEFLEKALGGTLGTDVSEAKRDLNNQYGSEITAARNIKNAVDIVVRETGVEPMSLRELYYDITKNPRDALTLIEDLLVKYFKNFPKIMGALLHFLGADSKAEASSIDHAKLYDLMSEVRKAQAGIQVMRLAKLDMQRLEGLLARSNIKIPPNLSVNAMALLFVLLAKERYPSASRVRQTLEAQLALKRTKFTQVDERLKLGQSMRKPTRNPPPR